MIQMRTTDKNGEQESLNEEKRPKVKKITYFEYFKEYSSRTSFHGIQYLGEDDRHLVERIWWLIMIVLSFSTCTYLIRSAWVKWNESPVVVSFSDTSVPVFMIPFPAITVCSEVKVRQTVLNITDLYDRYPNLTDEERSQFEAASLACDRSFAVKIKGNDTISDEGCGLIYGVSQHVELMLYKCHKGLNIINCTDEFQDIVTEEGYCYTINMMNAKQFWRLENLHDSYENFQNFSDTHSWDLDSGYNPNIKGNDAVYPSRAVATGEDSGFTLILQTTDDDIDYRCKKTTDGFKVALHMPVELPKSEQFFTVPLETKFVAAITPTIFTTSKNLKSYSPEKRKCFYTEERYLKYFKVYTQRNCETECIANFTLLSCGCVEFYMPHDRSTPICSVGKRNCTMMAQAELRTLKAGFEEEHYKTNNNPILYERKVEMANSCNCLPSCTSISYQAETSQNVFYWNKNYKEEKLEKIKGWRRSMIRLYYKEFQFLNAQRYELTDIVDFLANCGGLLGLCLGFSILSLMEIIYFLTIRAIFVWRKYQDDKKRARRF